MQHRVPVGERGVFGVVFAAGLNAGNAGVIDENIQRAVVGGDGLQRRFPVALLAHVQRQIAGVCADFGGNALAAGVVDIAQINKRAFRGESAGDGLADTTGSTGDEGGFSGKSCHDDYSGWNERRHYTPPFPLAMIDAAATPRLESPYS